MAFTRRETVILVFGDFLILCLSLWLALVVRNFALPSASYFETLFFPFLPLFLLSLIVFYIAGLYEKQTTPVQRVMGERVVAAQVVNAVIAALLFFTLQLAVTPKTILALYTVVSITGVSLWRFMRMGRELQTEARVPAVLVGVGSAVDELATEAQRNNTYLFRFTSRINPDEHHTPEALAQAVDAAVAAGAQLVVLDSRNAQVEAALSGLYESMVCGVAFAEFSDFYEDVFDRVPLDHIDYAWLLACLPEQRTLYDIAKRMFDIFAAGIGLIVASPFLLLAMLTIWPTGKALLVHERIGRGGRPFRMFKLRTMLYDDHGDPELRAKNRVTGMGKLLRRSRIDELPQLWNVLMGDLSFIGPRPELPNLAKVYEDAIPYYQARHIIAPGLSGWAQLNDHDEPKGGPDVSRTRVKLSYDLFYLKHRSFGLDTAIALKTLRKLLAFSGK